LLDVNSFLHGTYELPIQVIANLFPDVVVGDETITTLQQRKEGLVLIQFQKLKELVQNVRIAQEICTVVGTVE